MRHINIIGESNYDLHAFKKDPIGRLTYHGGGGGKSPAPQAPPPPPPPPPAEKKDPNVDTMIAQKKKIQMAGPQNQSTMLTGDTGVDPNDLSLGKSTLLGK